MDETYTINVTSGVPVSVDLGDGNDTVNVVTTGVPGGAIPQVRVTFTSAEAGDGNANDAGTMANQDAGLAVRLQAEVSDGQLSGAVYRFDDEGTTFISDGSFTFDVRDLVSGVNRGNQFSAVSLGTMAAERIVVANALGWYVNAGMGDDQVIGGDGNDFLVGGAGNDDLRGRNGDDSFIGGGGDDSIRGGDGNDRVTVNMATDGNDTVNLDRGSDEVVVTSAAGSQVRLSFTSSEVGNGNANDGGMMANQDGGLGVRMQLENADGTLPSAAGRYDDEGTSFFGNGQFTFDVRDLVSGTARGDTFDVVRLGTSGDDTYDELQSDFAFYFNGGAGNDRISGGNDADFLVGGTGDDVLNGRGGADQFIGGAGADTFVFDGTPGNDRLLDFVSGTDKLDMRAFGITADNVTATTSGADTILAIDSNRDGTADFQLTLVNAGTPVSTDYIL